MIRSTLRLMALAGVSLVFCAVNPASAQVYKWTDEQGNVHYGDNPYSIKDAKNGAKVIIPAKKREAEAEPEAALAEGETPPAEETAREKPADEQSQPVKASGEQDVAAQPSPKKEEPPKASTTQQEPPKQVKMSKRLLKAKKLEKEKSGSTATPPASTP